MQAENRETRGASLFLHWLPYVQAEEVRVQYRCGSSGGTSGSLGDVVVGVVVLAISSFLGEVVAPVVDEVAVGV